MSSIFYVRIELPKGHPMADQDLISEAISLPGVTFDGCENGCFLFVTDDPNDPLIVADQEKKA